jgi:elongation factor Ts
MTTTINAKDVSQLRGRTGAGMMDCKKALQETGGDMDKAVELLRKKGIAKAEKRSGRTAKEGAIGNYLHFNGKVAVLVEVNCETDFVARTDDFQGLVKDLERERAIFEAQVAESGKPEHVRGKIVDGKMKKFFQEIVLLDQAFVKEDKKSIRDLVQEVSAKLGENLMVRRFVRYELGEE